MGFMNILHNGYTGKLGETVGQKWKGDLTLRTYQAHNNSKSEAQIEQREKYLKLIQDASSYYISTKNIIVPKKKRMNKFNYFTSILGKIMQETMTGNTTFVIDDYRRKDIFYKYLIIYNGDIYAYIFLKEGLPPKDASRIPVSILINVSHAAKPIELEKPFFSGEIIPKRIKNIAVPDSLSRGFLAKLSRTQNDRGTTFFSIGKKEKNATVWSQITMSRIGVNITDANLEDLT